MKEMDTKKTFYNMFDTYEEMVPLPPKTTSYTVIDKLYPEDKPHPKDKKKKKSNNFLYDKLDRTF
jgi:hypothetical protein